MEAVLTSTHNLCFEQKYEEDQNFLSESFPFLVVKFSVYLNRRVFVMVLNCGSSWTSSILFFFFFFFFFFCLFQKYGGDNVLRLDIEDMSDHCPVIWLQTLEVWLLQMLEAWLYITVKYRSSSILVIIHQIFAKLWPFFDLVSWHFKQAT